ncbi:MAG: tetratricopeptide repeat protein [Desulfomonile tiedjei]|nr:tetratricopeptide repeat protein [Desulfomonile tiedjei]
MNLPGRNDPCPCGSGLKFKKCCLKEKPLPSDAVDDAAGLRVLGFKAMSLENWDEAIGHFKACLETSTDRHTILEAIASCYDGLEDYLLAAEYYEKAIAEAPPQRRFDLTYRLGIARGCGERIDKAAEAFQQCLDLETDEKRKGHVAEIIKDLEEIQEGKRSRKFFSVQVQLQRAFSDMEAEKFDAAAQRLETISRIDPDNPAILYNLGVVYTFLKREDAAVMLFQRCLDLNPYYVQAWYNMGQIFLIHKRDFSYALQCFDRAAAIRPDYVGAHHQRGIAWELLGDPVKAVECWNKTLELDPGNTLARENIQRVSGGESAKASVTSKKGLKE